MKQSSLTATALAERLFGTDRAARIGKDQHSKLERFLILCCAFVIFFVFSLSAAQAAVVNCQANRPGAGNVIYLYYPTASDSNFPDDVGDLGLTTSPLAAFDANDLDSGIGSTAQVRNAITERVKVDYCEFDVRVVQTTSANGTTNPNPSDARWQVVGIGSDSFAGATLFGVAEDVDTGDSDLTDFARVWADEFGDGFGGAGGALGGANSTLARWANAIAGTVSHEAGHNYGLSHDNSVSQPSEDSRKSHLMASGQATTGALTGADRVKDRHFSDASFEILAANIGLFEQTVSNWDFVNPNNSTADGFQITVLVLPAAGTPSKASIYTGGLSPWNDVSISADGSEMFKGTLYNRFQIDFTDPKSWNNGDPGEVGPGTEFHVGVGLTTNYIVRNTRLSSGGTALELNPRVVGYTTDGSFDPSTGDFHVTFSNADPDEGPLVLSDFKIRHLPRTINIDEMVEGGKLVGIDGLPVTPWNVRGTDSVVVSDTTDVAVGNLAEARAVDFVFDTDPKCQRGLPKPPPIGDSGGPFEVEYCPEGHVLGLFPSSRVYFEATVTDPDARFFDPNLGEFVTGPLRTKIFVQIPGSKPDLNENGVDDAIDIADGTCEDSNRNGVCDHVEPPTFKYAAKMVCGEQPDPGSTRLAQGFYATAINILNPNEERARFTKKLALTFPPDEQRPGEVLSIGKDELDPDHALEVDCIDVKRKLFPNGFPASYIKGFVVITSNMSLDVTAVYTTRPLDVGGPRCKEPPKERCGEAQGAHKAHSCCEGHARPKHCKATGARSVSIDVEQIRERKTEPKKPPTRQCPDLTIRDIGRPNVRCPSGTGTCRTIVSIELANIGNDNSGPFDFTAIFDPKQSVVVQQSVPSGLMAGEVRTFSVTTPRGGNCFDPDCTISVRVDNTDAVNECNERNNQGRETTGG